MPRAPSVRSSLLFLAVILLPSCGGCEGGGKHFSSGSLPAATPAPAAPAPAPTAAAPAPGPQAPVPDPSVGEDVPPITNDTATTIDTTAAAGLKHLIFQTTNTEEAGRFLSEYIVVVHAKEKSCVRMKVRPTAGLAAVVSDDALTGGPEGTSLCTAPAAAPAPASPAAGLNLADQMARDQAAEWEFITDKPKSQRGFQLTGQSAALCSPRLFRMEADQSGQQGLANVVSKTGRLLVVGSKVRIWLDEEFANVCTGGSGLDTRSAIAFAPLAQKFPSDPIIKDKLWNAQIQGLASEMDKIITDMTGTYGPVSDVDSSGYVEIFLSPEVNRHYFVKYESSEPDDFRAGLIYRPQDLAYYDSVKNPLSNEGEILYLWTPDPGGIYNYYNYPSSNSIDSNYAKGYLASQAMTLIIANQRLLVQKKKTIDDSWLLQGLAGLASAYYGGNDYSALALSHYLTSRSQYISLIQPIDSDLISDKYASTASEEIFGLRTLFAWYLHSRLCSGTSVAPCAKLKDLVTNAKTGKDALQAILSEDFNTTLENFGLSVGVALLDNPASAMAVWQKNPLPAGLPKAPTVLPDLTEIYPNQVPQTEEEDNNGALRGGSKDDRTKAGPFPSKKMLLFQPLAADNDMEFKLAPDAVAFILVTGLIDTTTDVTGFFGKGLNAVFIPAGERDPDKRRMHIEKVSENAHSDLRPENLTTRSPDVDRTFAYDKVYASLDYSVTPGRELWVLGSIDNFSLNIEGALTDVGDSDAYNVEIKPCDGVPAGSLAACQAATHQVLVQAVVRDFDKELAPMLLVTDTDRGIFRGHSVYGRVTDVDSQFKDDTATDRYMLCQSPAVSDGQDTVFGTNDLTTADGYLQNGDSVVFTTATVLPIGVKPYYSYTVANATVLAGVMTYQITDGGAVTFTGGAVHGVVHRGALGVCADGGVVNASVFDHEVTKRTQYEGFAHTYQNFLSLGPLGFPFTTNYTVTWKDAPECHGDRCYHGEESQRQNLLFALDKDLKAVTYHYQPSLEPPLDVSKLPVLDADTAAIFAQLKTSIEANYGGTCPQGANFVTDCGSIGTLDDTVCADPCSVANSAAVETAVQAYLTANDLTGVCQGTTACAPYITLMSQTTHTAQWLKTDKFLYHDSVAASRQTYYQPIEPLGSSSRYCMGEPLTTTQLVSCPIRSESISAMKDIRQQLNVTTGNLRRGTTCGGGTLADNAPTFKSCIDEISWREETLPDEPYLFFREGQTLDTDRSRVRQHMPITVRAGEITAKPERIQALRFLVPGTGTVANIIIGGRKKSQGKYLLRARIVDFK